MKSTRKLWLVNFRPLMCLGSRVLPRGGGRVLPRGGGRVLPRGGSRVLPRGGSRIFLCGLLFCSACSRTQGNGVDTEQLLQRRVLAEESARVSRSETEVDSHSHAQANFILGELALSAERYPEAMAFFKEAAVAEKNPAPTLRARYIESLVRAGELDKALREIDKALENKVTSADEKLIAARLMGLKAGVLTSLRRTDDAIVVYEEVIRGYEPESEEAHIMLGNLHADREDFTKSLEVLERLVQRVPRSFLGYFYLGRVAEAKGDVPRAEQAYRKALLVNPQYSPGILELARFLGAQKRFSEALSYVDQVIAEEPENPRARTLKAQLLLGSDKFQEAIQEFEAVGKLTGDPSDARFRIALIKLQQRDFRGAEVELSLVLARHSNNSTALYYRAAAYAGLNQVDEAVADLRQVGRSSEYFDESKTFAAYLLRQGDKPKEALEELRPLVDDAFKGEKSEKAKADDLKLLMFYVSLQREVGDGDGAVKTLQRLIDSDPKNDKHYFSLGMFYDDSGNFPEAEKAMRKALELNPQNANALNFLGYALVERGVQYTEAERLIKQAIEIDPKNGYFLDSLGWLYFKQKRGKEALKMLVLAVKYVPSDSVLLEHLALIQQSLGLKSEARASVEKALAYVDQSVTSTPTTTNEIRQRLERLASELKE